MRDESCVDASDDAHRIVEVRRGDDDQCPPGSGEAFAAANVLAPLLGAHDVVVSVVLDEDAEPSENQVATRDRHRVIEDPGVDLRVGKSRKPQQQTQVGLANRIDPIAHVKERPPCTLHAVEMAFE